MRAKETHLVKLHKPVWDFEELKKTLKNPHFFLQGTQPSNPLDNWQKEVLNYEGDIVLRCGRQVGKSEVIAEKTFRTALLKDNITVLVTAASQRQSSLLYNKILERLKNLHKELTEKEKQRYNELITENTTETEITRAYKKIDNERGILKKKPTVTEIKLTNGSRIINLPAGRTGDFIRGFTFDIIIADETAYIPEAVWTSIRPMIAVAKNKGLGWEIYLSTPLGKSGYFYERCHDKDFKQMHVKTTYCPRISRTFIEKERKRLTKVQFKQEYEAEFIDDHNQLFPNELIKNSMRFLNYDPKKEIDHKTKTYFIGVDIARFGNDENAFAVVEMDKKSKLLRAVDVQTTTRKSIVETVAHIQRLNDQYSPDRIYIDDTGVGGGATDLAQEKISKRKVRGLDNAKKSEARTHNQTGKLMKEELYSNLLILLERGQLQLKADLHLMRSLRSIQYEYNQYNQLKIYGDYTHITEALIRACWGIKERKNKLFLM